MSGLSAFTFKVSGHVQGVGFRAFVQRTGQQLGVSGWVKNEVDETVIGWVEGDAGLVKEFLFQLGIGNAWSSVDAVQQRPVEPSGSWSSFQIRY